MTVIGSDSEAENEAGAVNTGAPAEATNLPVAAPVGPFELVGGEELQLQPVLRVRAVGGVEWLRLVISSTELPARARVELREVTAAGSGVASRTPVQRSVRLTDRAQLVVLDNLDAGTYEWRVTTPGAKAAAGRVRVTAPVFVPPTTGESTSPVEEVPPSTDTDTNTGGNGGGSGGGGGGGGNEPDSPVGSNDNNDPTSPVPHRIRATPATAEPTITWQTNEEKEQL